MSAEALDGALDEVLDGMLFLEACLAGLAGSGLVLLHLGLVWLVLFRVMSLSLFARICTRFVYTYVDMIVQTVGVQVWDGVPSRH